jgi:hypothetical protein
LETDATVSFPDYDRRSRLWIGFAWNIGLLFVLPYNGGELMVRAACAGGRGLKSSHAN